MPNFQTTIAENPAVHSMRAMALALLPRMKWRHHGIGCLQGYLVEDAKPEVRMHIWCRRLLKDGIDESGDAHDHRFDMVSHVLCGRVQHEEIATEENKTYGEYRTLALTHARAAAKTNYHGPYTVLPGELNVWRDRSTIMAGQTYRFPARHFHRSPLVGRMDDVAVTIVEKHNQAKVPARLIYSIIRRFPVMAFGHVMDRNLVARVVGLAAKKLAKPL